MADSNNVSGPTAAAQPEGADAVRLGSSIDNLSFQSQGEASDDPSSKQAPFRLVYESKTSRIFCNGELGIKVPALSNPSSSDSHRRLLQHEHEVSRSMMPAPARQVLRVDTFRGSPAMYFQWADGQNVREWLTSKAGIEQRRALASTHGFELAAHLKVAIAVTKSVCEFHEAGMIHGHLNMDNVLLQFQPQGTQTYSATLIDYSRATTPADLCNIRTNEDRIAYADAKKKKDLNDLGLLLYSVLGEHVQEATTVVRDGGEDDEDMGVLRSKRGKRQHQAHQTNNLPLYLISLIASLLTPIPNQGGDNIVFYKNARRVLSDLQLAMQKADIYLKPYSSTDLVSRPLIFPQGSFYGRKTELFMLQHSFDAMMKGDSKPCALVVSGYAGTG